MAAQQADRAASMVGISMNQMSAFSMVVLWNNSCQIVVPSAEIRIRDVEVVVARVMAVYRLGLEGGK